MNRCVVPSIVVVTLTIMFGSTFMAQRGVAGKQAGTVAARQLAERSDRPDARLSSEPRAGQRRAGAGVQHYASGVNAAAQPARPR